MNSVGRTSKACTRGCFAKKFYDLPEADAVIYEFVEQYLNGLLPELNFRLFCDMELEPGHFPQRILWVEEITMMAEEKGDMACSHREKYCLDKRHLKEGKESAFTGQIKYIAEKIKNYFKTFWKKKGR